MERMLRRLLLKALTGTSAIPLTRRTPSRSALQDEFDRIPELGLYLHIPFCERICPYCPYHKELFQRHAAERYVAAVRTEIDLYAELVGRRPITSIYIGGGTPTTLLAHGLSTILAHIRDVFHVVCDVHMESHPNHLDHATLDAIRALGIEHLSMGVEALQDRHLRALERPYTVRDVQESIQRALSHRFKCVNVDVMFALPGQTCREVAHTGQKLVALGVDQIAAYPLFRFPYTRLGRAHPARNHGVFLALQRRKMLRILERIFYHAGYERTSAWAFTKRNVARYCSVTVPQYLGLGASGGSYLWQLFYLNTFSVSEYVAALQEGRLPIALSVPLTDRMQRAAWLYWRIYETRFAKADYRRRFGDDLDRAYGRLLRLLGLLGYLKDDGRCVILSDRGAFWLHALEDVLSIGSISRLWGALRRDPWPERVVLE